MEKDDMELELEARLRYIDAQRAKLVSALQAYRAASAFGDVSDFWKDLPKLDHYTVSDGVERVLSYAREHEQEGVSLSDLLSILSKHKVYTSGTASTGKRLLSETASPLRALVLSVNWGVKAGKLKRDSTGKAKLSDMIYLAPTNKK
ncbi:MAG TPA: hypothetical protein VKB58_08770 [Terriglobales bacterium]|nr:hypothetical protein [Terriglobales bacterium]